MRVFQRQMCKTGNSDFNKSTPCNSSETCGFDEKGPFPPPFFWTPLAMNAENRILSLFPLPYILGLPKGSIYLHVHILWRCPDMQHSETRVENLFTIMRHSHAAIPEAEDCLASFTRRSRSLWDDAAGAPISARFYWKETEWIWADRYPGNSSRIYSTSGKAGPFSLY